MEKELGIRGSGKGIGIGDLGKWKRNWGLGEVEKELGIRGSGKGIGDKGKWKRNWDPLAVFETLSRGFLASA